ncbi:MAG: S49 family peptidase [Gammaproteobacteria bacterium]|nr:S49 family peptidase [Gammaproteobacteria bacterium]
MTHRYTRIAERLFNTPLLILPGKLDEIIAGLLPRLGMEDLDHTPQPYGLAQRSAPDSGDMGYTVQDSVAVLNIFGTLAHRTTLKADSTMVLGYDRIARLFATALGDSAVRAIILNMDSPGGEVAGVFELTAQIHAARGKKPIVAVVNNKATSAGYLIASAADSISVSDTSLIGSIGVVMCHIDHSQALAKTGLAVTHLYAGTHKIDGNPFEPLSPEAIERFQGMIDHSYQLLVSAIATYRPSLSESAIRQTEAGLFVGIDGIKAGLADRMETLSQVIARLQKSSTSRHVKPPARALSAYSTGDIPMSDVIPVPEPGAVQPTSGPLSAALIAERCLAAGEAALGRSLLSASMTEHELEARLAEAKIIRNLAAHLNLKDQAEALILAGIHPDNAIHLLWKKDVERDQATPINNAIGAFQHGADARDRFIEGATAALMIRAGLSKNDPANGFRRFSLKEMSAECLRRAGVNAMGFSTDMAMVKAAITHTTSDFPVLLENVLNKILLESYQAAPDTWRKWCAVGNVSDFRPYKRIRLGSFGNLDKLTEAGEYKHKAIPDGTAESVSIDTKANTTTLTRQAIINDDLGGFARIAQMLSRAAARSIEADAYILLVSNPAMDSDSTALFHANHGNLHTGGSAAAITMNSVDAARSAIKSQMDRSGKDYLDIMEPFILLCPVAKAGAGRTVNESEYDPDTANKLQRTNITRGIFSAIVNSPRLTGTAWYLLADPNQYPTFEVLFLNGQQVPFSDRVESHNVDGIMWLIRHDYGVNVVDYVGAFKNDGA